MVGPMTSRDIDEDGVENDSIAEEGLAHEFGHECLAGRVVGGAEGSEGQGEHDHLPEAHVPGENDEAEKQRDAAKADLRDKQHAALVEPVDEQPSVGTEQQDRSIARCGCQSEQESRMGELQHQKSLGHGLDPGADQGQSLTSDVSAKITNGESAAKLMEPPPWFDRRRHRADGLQLCFADLSPRHVESSARWRACGAARKLTLRLGS